MRQIMHPETRLSRQFVIWVLCAFLVGHTEVSWAANGIADVPTREEAVAVCEFIAQITPSNVPNYGVKLGYFDANNNGKSEIVKEDPFQGTMGGDTRGYLAPDGSQIFPKAIGFEWKDYWTFGNWWIPYGGRFYRLTAKEEDGRYITYLSYVNATNEERILCEFANKAQRALSYVQKEESELCKKAAENELNYITDANIPKDEQKFSQRLNRWSTYPGGEYLIDFNNDGTKEHLLGLSFLSGAARGCTLGYYDLLDATGTKINDGDARTVLLELQKITDVNGHQPGPTCQGDLARWFRWNGHTYLEVRSKNADAPQQSTDEYDSIVIAEKDRIRQVCRASFYVHHSVAKYNEALWAK